MSPRKGNYAPHSHPEDALRRFEDDRRQSKNRMLWMMAKFALSALIVGALLALIFPQG